MKIKKKFGRGDEESVKLAELKKIKQRGKTIKEFIQEFRRVARESRYEEKALVKEFKRRINRVTRRKLIEVEKPPTSIEQWYEHVTNLDTHWRKSQKKEERKAEVRGRDK